MLNRRSISFFIVLFSFLAGVVARAEDTVIIPTAFGNQTAGRADAQKYELSTDDELKEFEKRLHELKPMLQQKRSGDEPFAFRMYFPHDKSKEAQDEKEKSLREVWTRVMGAQPIDFERHYLDRIPRFASAEDVAKRSGETFTQAELDALPTAADKPTTGGFWDRIRTPVGARAIKGQVGLTNAVALAGFRTAMFMSSNPMGVFDGDALKLSQLAAIFGDTWIEHVYKKNPTGFNKWLAELPIPKLSAMLKVFGGNLLLLYAARPALIEYMNTHELGPAYVTSLLFGGAVLLPTYVAGWNGYERYRQKGHMTEADVKISMWRGGYFSQASLVAASSGPATMPLLLATLPAENIPYIIAAIKSRRAHTIHDRLLWVDRELARNRYDLDSIEATEDTKGIVRGVDFEKYVAEAPSQLKPLAPPKLAGPPGRIRRAISCVFRWLGRRG